MFNPAGPVELINLFTLSTLLNKIKLFMFVSGLDKSETAKKHGEDQVKIWRRSYDVPPPAVDEKHEYYPGQCVRSSVYYPGQCVRSSVCLSPACWSFLSFYILHTCALTVAPL